VGRISWSGRDGENREAYGPQADDGGRWRSGSVVRYQRSGDLSAYWAAFLVLDRLPGEFATAEAVSVDLTV
jgi:hypothetical protein